VTAFPNTICMSAMCGGSGSAGEGESFIVSRSSKRKLTAARRREAFGGAIVTDSVRPDQPGSDVTPSGRIAKGNTTYRCLNVIV
jgi:hypothetical protein